MSVQRRAFGDVKNTISGTPLAFRDQKSGLLSLDKSTIHSTPATSKVSQKFRDSICSTPAASGPVKTAATKTPFSVYSGPHHHSTAKKSALRDRDAVLSATTALADSACRPKNDVEPRDPCTYLPLPETYEDLREDRHANELYTLDEDDELSFNQRQLYSEFGSTDFDEDRFFEELLSNK